MRQKFLLGFVLTAICFFSNCRAEPNAELEYTGEKSKLSAEIFEKLGYQVKSFDENPPEEWHKNQFQTVWTRNYRVKRKISIKEMENTFPRYLVREEIYESENLAAQRLKRIEEKPPNLPAEQDYYWMVTGFQNGKNVYFIQTDAAVFDALMRDFTDNLVEATGKS